MDDTQMTRIFGKHAGALAAVADTNERVHLDAARIALALAMHEMNGDGGDALTVDLRDYERLNGQIGRLNDWLAANEVVLYQDPDTDTADAIIEAATRMRSDLGGALAQIARMDADNTALIARCNQMERDLLALQQQRDELSIDNLHLQAQVDALTVHVATLEEQLSGATAAGHGTLAQIEMRNDGASVPVDYTGIDWSSLSEQAQDYRIGLDYHRWKWRDIPRKVRLDLVRCVIRNTGEQPTQAQFDAVRPPWMATATSQCAAFGAQWSLLANLDREIEVAP